MPIYIFAGPAVALIGILSVFFVLRRKSVEKRSMYSSRRSQIERKVKAARQRTLAPRGRGDKAPTDAEISAATPMTAAPAYEAPRQSSWDVGPTPAAAAPVYTPPAYEPPPEAPSVSPAEPSTPLPAQPEWTPAPAEQPVWTPAPSADIPRPREAEPVAAEPVEVPSGGGAAWSIVGEARPGEEAPAKDRGKDKGKGKQKAATGTGGAWELASGNAPSDDADEEVKKPSAAIAVAQYAVLVVGLVMVLIGVLVMVANIKVT
jgi:hypothetical protein